MGDELTLIVLFDSQLSMSGAEMMNSILKNLPRGFRFHPTDEELVCYLKLKIQGTDPDGNIIREVDVCKLEPWDLSDLLKRTDDRVWFFFSTPHYKYSKGCRSNRATKAGYWKPTGQDHEIESGNKKEVIGFRKTLVFYEGRGRAATRTNWVIHEYHANITDLPANAYVLGRLKETKEKKKKERKKKGSDVSSPDEAAADTGIHENDLTNSMTMGAGPSHHASSIASDIGNPQEEEMTPYDDFQLAGLLTDYTFTPPDPDWLPDIEKELHLDLRPPSSFNTFNESMQFLDGDATKFADSLIVDPDENHSEALARQRNSVIENSNLNYGSVGGYGKDGGSSSNTNTRLLQGFCLEAEDMADYGSVTDLRQNKNPIRESKKDCIVTQNPNANSKLSTWNEPVGMNQRGSFGSPETASASHEPSSLPGFLVYLLLIIVPIAVTVLGINERFKSLCHEVGTSQS